MRSDLAGVGLLIADAKGAKRTKATEGEMLVACW
jgi:hypothetical protein